MQVKQREDGRKGKGRKGEFSEADEKTSVMRERIAVPVAGTAGELRCPKGRTLRRTSRE